MSQEITRTADITKLCDRIMNESLTKELSYYRGKVRAFRKKFDLEQDELLHNKLYDEELEEYRVAETLADKADALADMIVVLSGAECDGFSRMSEMKDVIKGALIDGINLRAAFDIVMVSNMSKLVTIKEVKATLEKYQALNVPVEFLKVSKGVYAVYSAAIDNDEYPFGKLLKGAAYAEPDWSDESQWRMWG